MTMRKSIDGHPQSKVFFVSLVFGKNVGIGWIFSERKASGTQMKHISFAQEMQLAAAKGRGKADVIMGLDKGNRAPLPANYWMAFIAEG